MALPNRSVLDYVNCYGSAMFANSRTTSIIAITCFVLALVLSVTMLWYQKAEIPETNWQIGSLRIHFETAFYAGSPGLTPGRVYRDMKVRYAMPIAVIRYYFSITWGQRNPSGQYPWAYFGQLSRCESEESCNVLFEFDP